MWAPTVKEPLVKMLCHYGPVRGLAVESSGQFMATAGADQNLRIWDLRTYKPLYAYKLGPCLSGLAFSQRKILAAAVGNRVQVCNSNQNSILLTVFPLPLP